ncbi:MAG: MFS transporter [Bacteroidales bacterium]|nr:MFS transporter [Bacteroidales bacterium]
MKTKIITRAVLLVSFISLFTDIASEMLYPVMPVYLKSIGFSVLLIGILEGIAEATTGLSKGYFGNLSDSIGKRTPFIIIGYALSAISKPMLAIFTFPLWIFTARTMDRFGKGVRTSARDALLSDETIPENKGKVFGFHRGMDTIGAAIGPVLALIFLYFYPNQYKTIFILAIIPGIISITISLFLKDKKVNVSENKIKVSFFGYFNYWKKSSAGYKQLLIGLLAFTLFNSSDIFLLLVLKNKGFSDTEMIGFYIFYNLVYAFFSYPMGYLADKIGLKTVIIIGLILFSLVYLSIGFVSGYLMLGILFGIYGIYASATEGMSKALISNMSDKSETATAIGFYSSTASIATLIASSIAGFIWYRFSPVYTFVFSGIGVAFVVIYFLIVFQKQKIKLLI